MRKIDCGLAILTVVSLIGCMEAPGIGETATREPSVDAPTEAAFATTTDTPFAPTFTPSATASPTATAQPTASESGLSATPQEGHILVVVTTTETAYVRINMDGDHVYQGNIEPGHDLRYEATTYVEVLTDASEAVSVIYNGEVFPLSANQGDWADWVFTAGYPPRDAWSPSDPTLNRGISVFSPFPEDGWQRTEFPPHTPRVYATWQYDHVGDGLLLRREWYLNGELWHSVEEVWDTDLYGRKGSRQIFIQEEGGLPSGTYELRMYLDGIPQFHSGDTVGRSFEVLPEAPLDPTPERFPSPDGSRVAVIAAPDRLVLEMAGGEHVGTAWGYAVEDVMWFPDGRHLFITDRPTGAFDGPPQKPYDVWLMDAANGERHIFSEGNMHYLHDLLISPDTRYVAAVVGSGYGDACLVDVSLAIIELGADRLPKRTLYLDSFAPVGIEVSMDDFLWMYLSETSETPRPGVWESPTTLRIVLDDQCTDEYDGVYLLDIAARTATFVEGLD